MYIDHNLGRKLLMQDEQEENHAILNFAVRGKQVEEDDEYADQDSNANAASSSMARHKHAL